MATDSEFKFGPNQTKWLEMLEATDLAQSETWLSDGQGYCCLGIGLLAIGEMCPVRGRGHLNASEVNALGLHEGYGEPTTDDGEGGRLVALYRLNDEFKLSFKEIASRLRQYPRAYFRGPK